MRNRKTLNLQTPKPDTRNLKPVSTRLAAKQPPRPNPDPVAAADSQSYENQRLTRWDYTGNLNPQTVWDYMRV